MITKKLSDYANVISGYAFDSNLFNDLNGKPLIRIRDIKRGYTETFTTEEYKNEYIVKKDDILIGMDGEFNIAKWKAQDALLNQRVCKVIPNNNCNKDFIYFSLPFKLKKIESSTSFATVKHISKKQILEIEIPDYDLGVQNKIANKLNLIGNMINNKKQQIVKFDELVKSQFVEMFKGKNTPDYTKKIEELCSEMMIGPFGSALHKDEISTSGDVFVLGTDNAVENFFSKKEIRYIDNNKYQQLKKYTVKPDDIIISMMGTIGRTAVIPNDLEPAIISSHLCCLTPDKSKIYPDFLQKEFVLDDEVSYQIHSNKKGAIMSGLNLGIIKNITIHYPDLNKQKEFLNIVKQIDKQKFEFEKQLRKLEELQASLMQEYFG